jgi:signal peptidase II
LHDLQAKRGKTLINTKIKIVSGTALFIFILDLATKVWATKTLEGKESRSIVGDFLRLEFTRNSGAAFSSFADLTIILTILAIGALIAIIWYVPKISHPLWALGFGSLAGGISGNLADRLFRAPGFMEGAVVDWISLPNWPLFNIADSFIVTSMALMIFLSWREVPIRTVVSKDE